MGTIRTTVEAGELEQAVPALGGHHVAPGLAHSVEVLRDAHGIPHMSAAGLADAFFTQGYVHAQDRLWQMEYDRRRATGRWCEVVGPSALVTDTFARRAQLAASAQADIAAFDADTTLMFESYAAGVNAFIERTDRLPIEYALTGMEPELWEPWHSCVIFKIRHILMGAWQAKLLRARTYKTLGIDMAMKIRSEGFGPEVLVVPPGAEHLSSALRDIAELEAGIDAISRLAEFDSGSNNWAVHGSRTATGKPLVAGDPHRALDVPNVYYQNRLRCPEFDVIGYSFAGVPGFPHFAHNGKVAWCITHAAADYQDLFVERFNPANAAQYEFCGVWRDAAVHTEAITVRDAEPVEVTVTVTHHGPVVIGDPAGGYAMTMRYTAICEPNTGFGCFLPMLTAGNVTELDAAMRNWVDPCNNLIMGDTEGNIAYLTRGKVPVRSMSNAWLPVPGWTGEHEWRGLVPFEEMPRVGNPDTGYIATANNRIVGADFPHYIALDYAPPSRAQRIVTHLAGIEGATANDMAAIHADRISIPSALFVALLDGYEPDGPAVSGALAALRSWDGGMERDSAAAAIYIVMRDQLTRAFLEQPHIAPLRVNPFVDEPPLIGAGTFMWWVIPGLINAGDTALLPVGDTWGGWAAAALERAVAQLTAELGEDRQAWGWGALHRTNPNHPIVLAVPELRSVLNPPSVAMGGDGDTPQAAAILPTMALTVAGTSVTRYIFDVADWDNSRWIVPLGTSGHPGSPHFADQAERWSNVEYIPMTYSWDKVEAGAATRMTLEPEV